jgi:glutathione S-transferase
MSKPVLYIFAISHYCEKARWALDHFGIDYQSRYVFPGSNRAIAKKLGGSSGSLPFLQTSGELIAGSAAIIDWGEANCGYKTNSLKGEDAQAVLTIGKRLDDITGVHVRRYYYSDALLTDPKSVLPIFARDLPLFSQIGIKLAWPKIVPLMIKGMDLGSEQGLASRDIVLGELDWLDSLLETKTGYLSGNSLTRADITAASLLAPFVNPPEHPSYSRLKLPAALASTVKEWQERPILQWVKKIYTQWR